MQACELFLLMNGTIMNNEFKFSYLKWRIEGTTIIFSTCVLGSGVARASAARGGPQIFLATFFGVSLFFGHLRLFCNPFLKFLPPPKILFPLPNF